jgi:hypothetical protein
LPLFSPAKAALLQTQFHSEWVTAMTTNWPTEHTIGTLGMVHGRSQKSDPIKHDYTTMLKRSTLTTQFNITLVGRYPDGSNQTVTRRTMSVFNLYACNKLCGFLTPRGEAIALYQSSQARLYSWMIRSSTFPPCESSCWIARRIQSLSFKVPT